MDTCIVSFHIGFHAEGADNHLAILCFGHMASHHNVHFCWLPGQAAFQKMLLSSKQSSNDYSNGPYMAWCIAGLSHCIALFCHSNQTIVLMNISLPHF